MSRPRATAIQKLPDFTEDPFKDYRYEDFSNNIDPFSDEFPVTEDSNANKTSSTNNAGKLDPFGFDENSCNSRNSYVKAFDSDFSKTLPLPKSKMEKNTSKFNVDFNKVFSNSNKNNLGSNTMRSKSNMVERAIASKNDVKSEKKPQNSFKDKSGFGDKKNKNNKALNGNKRDLNLMEEQQLALASELSMKDENERRRLQDQEEAELAMALERSKLEVGKSGNN